MKVGLTWKGALYRPTWIAGVNMIATRLKCVLPPSLAGNTEILLTGFSSLSVRMTTDIGDFFFFNFLLPRNNLSV